MKKILTKLLLFVTLLFITVHCKQDDINLIKGTIDVHQHQKTKTQKVDLKDFPEILNYLETISNRNYSFSIDNTSKPSYDSTRDGDNITLLSINPDNAMQSVDINLNANFSISAIADNQQSEYKLSYYNLIIADHGNTNYSYILEYEYDKDWVASQEPTNFDYHTFTGSIRYYNIYGLFTEEINYVNGVVSTTRKVNPCPNGGSGGDDTPPNGDENGNGGGGGGTGGQNIVITCGCPPAHNGGNQNPNCNCDLADIIEIFGPITYDDMLNDPIRTPCNGNDGDDGIDPLPEECFLPNGDPIDCENPNIPLTDQELQENYFSLLMIFDEYLGSDFWSDYFLEIDWLGEHKEVASFILFYLMENNYSENSMNFVILSAIEALMNGAEVDFGNKVILDPSFVNNELLKCVYDKLTEDNSTLFKDTIGEFFIDPIFNLTFKVGNCATSDVACTNSSDPYNIVITIEDVNTNPLDLAATILHEAIHAELARFVEQFETGVDVNNRPQLFQFFVYYAPLYGDNEYGSIDHIYMTLHYINPIASALMQFDNNNYPFEYYKGFAWDGLERWDAANLLDIDPLADEYGEYRNQVIENSSVCN